MAGQEEAKTVEDMGVKTMMKSLPHANLTDGEKIGPLTKENFLAMLDTLAKNGHARWWPSNITVPEDPEAYKRDKGAFVRELHRKPVYRMAMNEAIQVIMGYAGPALRLIVQNADLPPGDSFGVMEAVRAYAVPSTEMAKDKLVDSVKNMTMADCPQLTHEEFMGRMLCKIKLLALAGRRLSQEAENNLMMNALNVGQMKAVFDMLKGYGPQMRRESTPDVFRNTIREAVEEHEMQAWTAGGAATTESTPMVNLAKGMGNLATGFPGECYNCGKTGHRRRDCPKPNTGNWVEGPGRNRKGGRGGRGKNNGKGGGRGNGAPWRARGADDGQVFVAVGQDDSKNDNAEGSRAATIERLIRDNYTLAEATDFVERYFGKPPPCSHTHAKKTFELRFAHPRSRGGRGWFHMRLRG